MDNEEKQSLKYLEDQPYRYLQQMAKSIGLPSNFKKVYLIQLIQAKKFRTEREVNIIIQRVKLERLRLSKARRENKRRKMQTSEVPSTSKSCFSPPITFTPKRPNTYIRNTPELRKTLISYNPKRNLIQNINQNPTPTTLSSDRILRSCNMKTLKPNYALLSGQDVFKSNPKETRIKIVTNNGGYPQFNVTAKCIVKKHRPSVLANGRTALKTQLMLTQSTDLLQNPLPVKRQRTLSGIYPLMPPEAISRNLHTTESVCLRKIDGSITRINALVQKRIHMIPRPKNSYRNTEINIQDLINSIDDNLPDVTDNTNNNLQSQYPNLSSLDTSYTNIGNPQVPTIDNIRENDLEYSVYYHKKIRSEQIRCQRLRELEDNERLPKIGDVFSKFNDVYRRDLAQPLYVQVSSEYERSQNCPIFSNANTMMLEPLYNFKSSLLTNTPLLQVATTSNTKCVYTVLPTVVTAVTQAPTIVSDEAYVSSFEVDRHRNQHDIDPRLQEFLHFSEQTAMRKNFAQCEDFSTSTSSLGTSQDMSGTVSIPEMVEDALEIISQDGDYMEQIAMDGSMQCLLCSWAGPKFTLEYHIKKEHSQSIHPQRGSEWAVPWTLPPGGGGRQGEGAGPQLLEHDSTLYVLTANYEDPDYFTASLSSLSTEPVQKFGSITIYNKISGEPFSWSGLIQPLPPNFPYENETSCLKIELSRLDLLPNSANLKLINRELVMESPSKVIIGQPMLNDIHLILFVKIFN